jgi:hypothetical protein
MSKSSSNAWKGYHYILNTNKEVLSTSNASYPIVCVDSQAPTIEWTTGLYVFDDNEPLGFPGIGRVHNTLGSTSQTAHLIGVPSTITSQTKPDSGQNRWLPVGTWLSKTIFIRIA